MSHYVEGVEGLEIVSWAGGSCGCCRSLVKWPGLWSLLFDFEFFFFFGEITHLGSVRFWNSLLILPPVFFYFSFSSWLLKCPMSSQVAFAGRNRNWRAEHFCTWGWAHEAAGSSLLSGSDESISLERDKTAIVYVCALILLTYVIHSGSWYTFAGFFWLPSVHSPFFWLVISQFSFRYCISQGLGRKQVANRIV